MPTSKTAFVYLVVILHIALLSACVAVNKKGGSNAQKAAINIELGSAYLGKNDLDNALSNLKKAISFDPDSVKANALLGILYARLDQANLADDYFENAVELVKADTQEFSFVHNQYGVYLCKNDQLLQADEHFQKAIENGLNKRPQVAMENAGVCASKRKAFDLAEKYYRSALNIAPKMSGVLFKMAQLKLDSRSYLSARAYIQRYHEVAEANPDSYWVAIQIENALGALHETKKLVARLKMKFPDSKQAQHFK